MDSVLERIGSFGILPMVATGDPADAPALMRALGDGGLPVVGFSFGAAAGAGDAIRAAVAAEPDALVGAVDVRTLRDIDAAFEAGARFVVSPAVNAEVVRLAHERDVAVLPECTGAAGLDLARSLGLDAVAVSSQTSDGTVMLRALIDSFPGMRLVPVGDIDAGSTDAYLACREVLAVGVSWLLPPNLVRSRDWSSVTSLTRDAVLAMHHFSLAHVGLSSSSATDAEAVARRFGAMFGFGVKVGNSSVFAGPNIEVVKGQSRGELGHLAIKTASIPRAVAYLARMGFAVDPASEKVGSDGSVTSVYLVDEVAGFALHLLA
jgi:2-dehydro-3-deoxyphosphogluconate aldolase/(4S)-4-hydroxy-2-oxoglutarate aldolase